MVPYRPYQSLPSFALNCIHSKMWYLNQKQVFNLSIGARLASRLDWITSRRQSFPTVIWAKCHALCVCSATRLLSPRLGSAWIESSIWCLQSVRLYIGMLVKVSLYVLNCTTVNLRYRIRKHFFRNKREGSKMESLWH